MSRIFNALKNNDADSIRNILQANYPSPHQKPSLVKSPHVRVPAVGRDRDVNARDRMGRTPLHLAVTKNKLEIVRLLLNFPNLNPNLQDSDGWTPLHRAFYFGNLTVALALLERPDLDTSIKDKEGNTAFDVLNSTIDASPASDVLSTQSEIDTREKHLYTWGANTNFLLGHSDSDDRSYPERVQVKSKGKPQSRFGRIQNVRSLSAKEEEDEEKEEMEDDENEEDVYVADDPYAVANVAIGKLHTSVVTNGVFGTHSNLYTCGFGNGGRLGNSFDTKFVPEAVRALGGNGGSDYDRVRVSHVALGRDHTVVVTTVGDVLTFGSNEYGQLGYIVDLPAVGFVDEVPFQLSPRKLTTLKKEYIIGAAASRVHSAVFSETALYTWGLNQGQLGYHRVANSNIQVSPRQVSSLPPQKVSQVVATDFATCVLLRNHDVLLFEDGGVRKLNFSMHRFPKEINVYYPRSYQGNYITKLSAGGQGYLAALSCMGDVFIWMDGAKARSIHGGKASRTATIASTPTPVWSLRKKHVTVRDMALGMNGSLIIATETGHVYLGKRRSENQKQSSLDLSTSRVSPPLPHSTVNGSSNTALPDAGSKSFSFSKIPGFNHVVRVAAGPSGAYAAITAGISKKTIQVPKSTLSDDFGKLLPHRQNVHPPLNGNEASNSDFQQNSYSPEFFDEYWTEERMKRHEERGQGELCDVVFVLEGDETVRGIFAHRVFLIARCPALAELLVPETAPRPDMDTVDELKMFSRIETPNAFANLVNPRTVCLRVSSGIEPETLLLFLDWVYTDSFVASWDFRIVHSRNPSPLVNASPESENGGQSVTKTRRKKSTPSNSNSPPSSPEDAGAENKTTLPEDQLKRIATYLRLPRLANAISNRYSRGDENELRKDLERVVRCRSWTYGPQPDEDEEEDLEDHIPGLRIDTMKEDGRDDLTRCLEACADVGLRVAGGRIVKAHRVVLAGRNEFFKALLGPGSAWASQRALNSSYTSGEKDHERVDEPTFIVDLPHMHFQTLQIVLRYIYTDPGVRLFSSVSANSLDEFLDFVIDILASANEFLLPRLKRISEHVLAAHVSTFAFSGSASAYELLKVADLYEADQLKQVCLGTLCKGLEGIIESGVLQSSESDGTEDEIIQEMEKELKRLQLEKAPFWRGQHHDGIAFSGREDAEEAMDSVYDVVVPRSLEGLNHRAGQISLDDTASRQSSNNAKKKKKKKFANGKGATGVNEIEVQSLGVNETEVEAPDDSQSPETLFEMDVVDSTREPQPHPLVSPSRSCHLADTNLVNSPSLLIPSPILSQRFTATTPSPVQIKTSNPKLSQKERRRRANPPQIVSPEPHITPESKPRSAPSLWTGWKKSATSPATNSATVSGAEMAMNLKDIQMEEERKAKGGSVPCSVSPIGKPSLTERKNDKGGYVPCSISPMGELSLKERKDEKETVPCPIPMQTAPISKLSGMERKANGNGVGKKEDSLPCTVSIKTASSSKLSQKERRKQENRPPITSDTPVETRSVSSSWNGWKKTAPDPATLRAVVSSREPTMTLREIQLEEERKPKRSVNGTRQELRSTPTKASSSSPWSSTPSPCSFANPSPAGRSTRTTTSNSPPIPPVFLAKSPERSPAPSTTDPFASEDSSGAWQLHSFRSIQNEQIEAKRALEEARNCRRPLREILDEESALAEIREYYRRNSMESGWTDWI